MDVVKEQNAWGAHNTLSLDASIALSAVAALVSLVVADGDLAATLTFLLAGAAVAGIAVTLLRARRPKYRNRAKINSSASPF